MNSGPSKYLAAIGCLVVVWIATYWLYEPGGRDSQTLAPLPRVADTPLAAARPDITAPPISMAPRPAPDLPHPSSNPGPDLAKQGPTPDPKPDSKPQGGVIPPEFENYTVKPGETFETIAKARYGSSSRWSVIAQANPMKDPKRIKPGDQIRLPKDPTNIQGKPAPDAPRAEGFTEYTVQPGDTLSGIAKTLWGSGKEWRRILEANKASLPSEDRLKVGMKLRIPPKPAD